MKEKSSKKVDILGLVSFGLFLLLVGTIYVYTPNLIDGIKNFIQDFRIQQIYPGASFFAPSSNHPVLYNAVFQFCIIFAILQIGVLIARLVLRESIGRKAGTISGIIFWLGAAFALNSFMVGVIDWFVFLGWLVIIVGIVVTARSAIALVFYGRR